MPTKKCTNCGDDKDVEDFNKHPTGKYGRQAKCRECSKKYASAYYEKNSHRWAVYEKTPEENRAAAARHRASPSNTIKLRYLKHRYGLTVEQYEAMVVAQGGLCKICRRPPNGRWKRLAVDHDHTTNQVRGLLCHSCNAGLGYFKDSVDALREAIAYIVGS